MENYDIIGDTHGFVAPLKTLLAKLGYTINSQGYYSHPNRKVIFLGDFIDWGDTQNVACLDYSIAKKGKLVAYCWNQGDGDLSNERFVWVD